MTGYRLNVSIGIERMNESGGYTGERLSITEDLRLDVHSFLEIAQVLGRFHDLAENIKAGGPDQTMAAAADVDQAEAELLTRLVLSEECGGTGRVLWSRPI